MGYVVDITKVSEVKETTCRKEVNRKVSSGWMLLAVVKPNPAADLVFSLGKVPVHVNASN